MGSKSRWAPVVVALALVAGCARSTIVVDSAVVITIDTWRADRFGAGGHPEVRTPHLDRFFRGGTQYSDAHSAIPTTLASHATIFSGEWPTGHGVPRNAWPLSPETDLLAEMLGRHDFATGAFVSSAALHPAFGLDQGFGTYDFEAPLVEERDQDWRAAEDTLARARAWWDATSGRRLLWVHLFEPHFPYDPAPEDFALYDTGYRGPADGSMDFLFAMWENPALLPPPARDHLEALYHAEITGLDRKLGGSLDWLSRQSGVITVVVADHGESLEDHGLRFKHGPAVYPADVQVPLVIRGCPPFAPAVSSRIVRTVDLVGTILGRLGLAETLPPDARDLAATDAAGELAFAEASMPWDVEEAGGYPNRNKQRVIRSSSWAYVETPYQRHRAWFRRATDPDEVAPVPGPSGEERRRMEDRLQEWIDRGRPRQPPATVDPDLLERLKSLGYIE